MRISDWSSDVCSSDLSPHSRDTWLLLMPSRPMARTRSSTERVEMPWTLGSSPRAGSGFLDDRGQRLLGQAPGLQEGREVAPLAQLGNPQFDRAGTGLPVPVAVAVAMVTPFGAALAMAGAAQALALQLHQPLGRSEEHTSELQSLMRISYA